MDGTPLLLTKTEARRYLGGIAEKSLDRLRAAGQLRAVQYRPNGKVFFDREDLDEFIERYKSYRVEDPADWPKG